MFDARQTYNDLLSNIDGLLKTAEVYTAKCASHEELEASVQAVQEEASAVAAQLRAEAKLAEQRREEKVAIAKHILKVAVRLAS
jgi:hypothetical protein